ncbi:hypothetical protein CLV42_106364 [Chitinophaga ginsengisoli]|uniref:Uncharacterized protein n=1 Tax=Chitinophaga ginsengisoli TaxID=363837 RepID=A0A2P8G7T9_9BACT|nr:hypothetical protein CLV42_106364 [Chitinophaga ginsengisoli]
MYPENIIIPLHLSIDTYGKCLNMDFGTHLFPKKKKNLTTPSLSIAYINKKISRMINAGK